MDDDPPPKRALAHASPASLAPLPHLSSDSREQLTQYTEDGTSTTSGLEEHPTRRKRRRTSSLGVSEGLSSVMEEGGEQDFEHLGPGRRRGRVDYASLAAETSDPYGFYPSHTRSSDRVYRPSGSTRSTPPATRPLPARMVDFSGWTLADDVELAQLARSFKIVLPNEAEEGEEEEGEIGVDWEQLKRRFGGGLRKTRDELEERWRTLEDEVNDAIAGLNGEEEEEGDAESSSNGGWSPALDAALLSAIDSLSSTPIAAYASLDILLSDPFDSNYAATAWETIGELFENQVKASSLNLPAELDISHDALYARHQALLHPAPPPPPRPARHRSPHQSRPWSRSETSLLLSTVISLGGDPSFPNGGWDDRVEETARWVEISVAVGGEREMRDVVGRWAEMRGEVEGQKEGEMEEETAMGLGEGANIAPSPVAPSPAVTPVPIPATTSSDPQPALRRKRNWTSEEDRLLSQLSLAGVPHAQIAEQLDRSEKAVDRRLEDWAREKKAKRQEEELFSHAGDDEWEEWEEEAVEGDDDYPPPGSSPAAELACSGSSSSASASKHRQPWTASDDETLHRLNEEGVSPADIAQQLGRTEVAIVIRLGIWTREQKRKEPEGLLQEGKDEQGTAISFPSADGLSTAGPAVAPKPAASAIRRPWSADEDALAVRLSEEGFSHQEIGVQLERTTQAVEYRLRAVEARGDLMRAESDGEYDVQEEPEAEAGEEWIAKSTLDSRYIPTPLSLAPFTAQEDARLLQLHAEGKTFPEIGLLLSRDRRRVGDRYRQLMPSDKPQRALDDPPTSPTDEGEGPKRRRRLSQAAQEADEETSEPSPQPSGSKKTARPFTPADDDQLLNLRAGGMKMTEIAAKMGRGATTLSKRWRLLKGKGKVPAVPLPLRSDSWTTIQDEQLRAQSIAGDTFPLIGARLGRSTSAVQQRWAAKKNEWEQAGLLPSPSTPIVPSPQTLFPPLSSASFALPPTSSSRLLQPRPPPVLITAKPALPTSSPTFRRLPPLPAASFTFSTFAQPPPATATAPTHSAPTSAATPAQPHFRPARHHPLLSRIRQVLEENEVSSDEED